MCVTFPRSYMTSISFKNSSEHSEGNGTFSQTIVGLGIAYASLKEPYVHLGETSIDRVIPTSVSFRMSFNLPELM